MSKHAEGQFVISGGGDDFWQGVNAKTLNGAKSLASKNYQASAGGKIEVGQVRGEQVEVVAVKYGHEAWTQEP